MYKAQVKGKHNFLILVIFAILMGWIFIKVYRPIVLEAGCSNVASASSNILLNSSLESKEYSYDQIKQDCLLNRFPN